MADGDGYFIFWMQKVFVSFGSKRFLYLLDAEGFRIFLDTEGFRIFGT
jgi:hypothetical protein